ncbi:PAAR-like protein [Lacrimispora brassicae]
MRGSKLSCSYGTDYSLLDTSQDHGIYKENPPVMTTIDGGKSNIYHFGSCLCPEFNYTGHLPMTVGTRMSKYKVIDIIVYGRSW